MQECQVFQEGKRRMHAGVWNTQVYGACRCMVHAGVWCMQACGAHRHVGRLLAFPLGFSRKKNLV